MSKKYTPHELKSILRDVLERGYSHINDLRKRLVELNLTDSEIKAPIKGDRALEAEELCFVMAVINDILHPGHSISLHLFPRETHSFIEQCIEQYSSFNKKVESSTLKKDNPRV